MLKFNPVITMRDLFDLFDHDGQFFEIEREDFVDECFPDYIHKKFIEKDADYIIATREELLKYASKEFFDLEIDRMFTSSWYEFKNHHIYKYDDEVEDYVDGIEIIIDDKSIRSMVHCELLWPKTIEQLEQEKIDLYKKNTDSLYTE